MRAAALTIALLMSCSNFVRAQNLTNVPIPNMLTTNLASLIKQPPRSEKDYELKERAMREAGEGHCTDPEVINALLDNMRYIARLSGNDPMQAPKYALHPARDALNDIGRPVIPFILERIKRGEDALPPGYVPPDIPKPVYLDSSSNSTRATLQLLKAEDYAVLSKVGQYTSLLKAIADKESSALLQEEISTLEEQKAHLDKSLKLIQQWRRQEGVTH